MSMTLFRLEKTRTCRALSGWLEACTGYCVTEVDELNRLQLNY